MKKWTILLLALLCSTAGAAAQDFSVVNPRCEYRDEPLGINTLTPRFSWQISARDRGFLQSAYELIVGDDRAVVAAGRGNLWRVKAKGAESLHIPYAGKALESGKEYYWSVRVWNAAGEVSPWMPVNRFSTGLMSPDAWSGARWIAMEVQPDSLRLVPGGMLSNLVAQLTAQKALDKLDAVLLEVPKVRKDLGYPPLVTPMSQMVGVQATVNVLTGGRYKNVSKEIKAYVKGEYGRAPGKIDPEVQKLVLGDEKPITQRYADLLEPGFEKAKRELGERAHSDEDVLSYIAFPAQAEAYFEKRDRKEDDNEIHFSIREVK